MLTVNEVQTVSGWITLLVILTACFTCVNYWILVRGRSEPELKKRPTSAPKRYESFPTNSVGLRSTLGFFPQDVTSGKSTPPPLSDLTFAEYKQRAMALCKVWNYRHAVFGLVAEAGEVAGLHQKSEYKGTQIDLEQLSEELGDVAWYWTMCCCVYGLDPIKVLESNVIKLEKRHGTVDKATRP